MNQETLLQFLKLSADNDGQILFRVHDDHVEYPPTIGWVVEFKFVTSSDKFISIDDIMAYNDVVKDIGEDAYLIIDKPTGANYSLSFGLRFFSRTIARSVYRANAFQNMDGVGIFDLRANKWTNEL